ncbi:MAG: hypothetical protein ACT4P6_06500 [Gemmatimonadaceae bacterium]
MRVTRTATAPVIDARLDDEVWQGAPQFTRFVQYEPDARKHASIVRLRGTY